jgi:hypothetical protein
MTPNVSKLNRKAGRRPVGPEAVRNRPGFVGLQRVLGNADPDASRSRLTARALRG